MGWTGSVYFWREARYAWQSYWTPDARIKIGRKSIVRNDGADIVSPSRVDLWARIASSESC